MTTIHTPFGEFRREENGALVSIDRTMLNKHRMELFKSKSLQQKVKAHEEEIRGLKEELEEIKFFLKKT